jgi:hypothetical protein
VLLADGLHTADYLNFAAGFWDKCINRTDLDTIGAAVEPDSTTDIEKTLAYMDIHDSKILSTAHTAYRNIVDTLDGTLIIGNIDAYYTKGKVLIAAANPDLMESYIEEGDLVILGNRYESQLCAIQMNAACIIVCEDAPVSLTIQKMAEEHGCTVIRSPHDTYTVARLINQSMPISHFMCRDNLITFRLNDYTDDIKVTMAKAATKSRKPAKKVMSKSTPKKTAPRKKKATVEQTKEESDSMLREFLIDEIKDIYWAEKHLTGTPRWIIGGGYLPRLPCGRGWGLLPPEV